MRLLTGEDLARRTKIVRDKHQSLKEQTHALEVQYTILRGAELAGEAASFALSGGAVCTLAKLGVKAFAKAMVKSYVQGQAQDLAFGALAEGAEALGFDPDVVDTARSLASAASMARGLARGQMCFVAGTQVLTCEGSKNIEDVVVGDEVLSRSDATGEQGYRTVLQTFVTAPMTLYHLKYRARESSRQASQDAASEGGEEDPDPPSAELVGTGEHPFWRVDDRRWVPLRELRIGDRLSLSDGGEAVVVGLSREDAAPGDHFTTYNFEVEGWHTYFVSPSHPLCGTPTVWVHNVGERCRKSIWGSSSHGRVQGRTGAKVVVIGENMRRVEQYAATVGAHVYSPKRMNPVIRDQSIARDKRWLRDQIRQGKTVVDIGPDFARRQRGDPPSPWYGAERQVLRETGYKRYIKAWERHGRLSGGSIID
jgi:hypothetical protein